MKYSVNVIGKNGYSFGIVTSKDETEDSIIDFCLENDIFDNVDDAYQCIVSPLDDEEFKFFEETAYSM